jgi:hypothetical protein
MALGRWRRGSPILRDTLAPRRVQKARLCAPLARRALTQRRRPLGELPRARTTLSRPVRAKQSRCGLPRGLPGRHQPRQARPATSRRPQRRFRRGRCRNRRHPGRPLRRRRRTAVPQGWRRFLAWSMRPSASRAMTRLRRSAPLRPRCLPQRPAGLPHLVNLTTLLSHGARGARRRRFPRRGRHPLPVQLVARRPTSPRTTLFRAGAGRRPGNTAWIRAGSARPAGPTSTPPAALREAPLPKPRR